MARDYDGVNDRLTFGSDASIDGDGSSTFLQRTIAMWLKLDTSSGNRCLLGKSTFSEWLFYWNGTTAKLHYFNAWSGAPNVEWRATTNLGTTMHHIAVTYDQSSTSNDALIYVDGVLEGTITELSGPPSGTPVSDAALNLVQGELSTGAQDLDGQIQNFVYDNAVWSAADINRAQWWGTRGGAVKVHHPFFTDKLANEGTATADASVSGSVMGASIPRVERRWGMLMGVGR